MTKICTVFLRSEGVVSTRDYSGNLIEELSGDLSDELLHRLKRAIDSEPGNDVIPSFYVPKAHYYPAAVRDAEFFKEAKALLEKQLEFVFKSGG